jgi:hypothetical protein
VRDFGDAAEVKPAHGRPSAAYANQFARNAVAFQVV